MVRMLYYYHGELRFIVVGINFQQAAVHTSWQTLPCEQANHAIPGTPFMAAWHYDHLLPQTKTEMATRFLNKIQAA